jgi:hypothetical protein
VAELEAFRAGVEHERTRRRGEVVR